MQLKSYGWTDQDIHKVVVRFVWKQEVSNLWFWDAVCRRELLQNRRNKRGLEIAVWRMGGTWWEYDSSPCLCMPELRESWVLCEWKDKTETDSKPLAKRAPQKLVWPYRSLASTPYGFSWEHTLATRKLTRRAGIRFGVYRFFEQCGFGSVYVSCYSARSRRRGLEASFLRTFCTSASLRRMHSVGSSSTRCSRKTKCISPFWANTLTMFLLALAFILSTTPDVFGAMLRNIPFREQHFTN